MHGIHHGPAREPLPTRGIVIGVILGLAITAGVGGWIWNSDLPTGGAAPGATEPGTGHNMSGDAACAHMPEHCEPSPGASA